MYKPMKLYGETLQCCKMSAADLHAGNHHLRGGGAELRQARRRLGDAGGRRRPSRSHHHVLHLHPQRHRAHAHVVVSRGQCHICNLSMCVVAHKEH